MKIIINSRIYQEKYSGVQNYIFNLYTHIFKIDKNNQYIFVQSKISKMLGETQIFGYIPGNLGKIIFDYFLVIFLIKKMKGQIFHGPAFTLPIFKSKGCKYVVTIHDLAFLIYPKHYPWFFRQYMYLTVLNSIRISDVIICISESTKNDLKTFYSSVEVEKIRVVPLGVSEDFFTHVSEERIIPEKYFFSLITHPRRKNILRILDIIAEHRKDLAHYRYVIAGIFGDESRKEIQGKINALAINDMIIIYGYGTTEEVKNLYRNAEFCIYPSYYEGFGLPILEAMASGCPVISSDNSSLPEVNPNKECQFQATDNMDIYRSMRYILDLDQSKRAEIIEKNIKFARSMTWENTAKKTMDIFNSL